MTTDWETARDALRDIRKYGLQRPEEVVKYAIPLLRDSAHKLGNEEWLVREQLVMAGLDIYDARIVSTHFDAIKGRFPNSKRTLKLKATVLEGQGHFENEEKILKAILKDEPTDVVARKRRVAMLKSQGRHDQAIAALNTYLRCFMADEEAWLDLANMYIRAGLIEQAVFCLEDVLLADRYNMHMFTKYADAMYTQGDYITAKKYYVYSLSISSGVRNIRALFGLCQACSVLEITKAAVPQTQNQRLFEWGERTIIRHYLTADKTKLDTVVTALMSLRPDDATLGNSSKKKK